MKFPALSVKKLRFARIQSERGDLRTAGLTECHDWSRTNNDTGIGRNGLTYSALDIFRDRQVNALLKKGAVELRPQLKRYNAVPRIDRYHRAGNPTSHLTE